MNLDQFENRVRKTIRVNRLLTPTDKTAVALSGGKDSSVVLYLLKKFSRMAPRSELIAISIDPGIKGLTLEYAKRICKELEIPQYIYSFKDEFGFTFDGIVQKLKKLENPAPACSYCGVLRRRLLNEKARELGATKIATGHNLDDEIQTGLMNFIRGDLDRMARMGAISGVIKDEKFVPRIKPLRECPENEVKLYAELRGLKFGSRRCPYSKDAFRGTIRSVIDNIEEKHPGSKFQILRSIDRLVPILRERFSGKINRCKICGELTSEEVCKVCEIK